MQIENILGQVVDRMAQVKAQIADLKKEEAALRQELVDSGESVVDGLFYRAAISQVDGKVSVDWQSIAMHFKPSRQLIKAHSNQGEPFDVVRVSARKSA
jgi:hypothetical protein